MIVKVKYEYYFTKDDRPIIKKALKERHTTLKHFAKGFGISYSHLNEILNGKYNGYKVAKVLLAVGVKLPLDNQL